MSGTTAPWWSCRPSPGSAEGRAGLQPRPAIGAPVTRDVAASFRGVPVPRPAQPAPPPAPAPRDRGETWPPATPSPAPPGGASPPITPGPATPTRAAAGRPATKGNQSPTIQTPPIRAREAAPLPPLPPARAPAPESAIAWLIPPGAVSAAVEWRSPVHTFAHAVRPGTGAEAARAVGPRAPGWPHMPPAPPAPAAAEPASPPPVPHGTPGVHPASPTVAWVPPPPGALPPSAEDGAGTVPAPVPVHTFRAAGAVPPLAASWGPAPMPQGPPHDAPVELVPFR